MAGQVRPIEVKDGRFYARLALRDAPAPLALGDWGKGQYLGQKFTGLMIGLPGPDGHHRTEVRIDQPVDVVTFDSFLNLRRPIVATIDEDGRPLRQTSDGTSQLLVARNGS